MESFAVPVRTYSIAIPFTDELIDDLWSPQDWINLAGAQRAEREAMAALQWAKDRADRQRKPRPDRLIARTAPHRAALHNERFLHFDELRSIYASDW